MTLIYYPPTQNGLQKSLNAQLDTGVTASMTLNNVTGVQNKPGVVLLARVDSGGTELDASLREFIVYTGTSGSTLTGLTRGIGGSTDQDHAIGTVVEFIHDITFAQGIIDFLLAEHNEADGTHKSALVTTLKASGSEVNTGTSDVKIVTPKAIADSDVAYLSDITVTPSSTNTLTNKRITKRTDTVTSSATPTINTDNVDIFTITALATAITSMTTNLSGTPTLGQTLIIRIKDDGTSRAITWGASFASRGATLPTATTISKTHYVGLIYNTTTSTWDCVASTVEV